MLCSKNPRATAETGERLRKQKSTRNDYYFVPIGIETYGSWCPEGLHLIKAIGQKMKEVTGERRSTFYVSQIGISIAIQIENSNCVPDPNFYLKDSVDVFCGTRTLK